MALFRCWRGVPLSDVYATGDGYVALGGIEMTDHVTQEEFKTVCNATLELLNRMKLCEEAIIILNTTLATVAEHLKLVSDVTMDSGAVEAARQRRENQ